MSISSGTRFNSYLIGESIGVGGMGEVYRATDTKLKRDVAIKVLPQDFAADVDRLARFQREAELLASLNHPNIAQIYGLESANGITALIMELIDGPTLAERLEQGPLPSEEALNIALQIADALEAAHERGIVHRDLKPANVKLKPDGRVKVLDFGIAKAMDTNAGYSGPHSPALTTPAMTQSGMILGTAAYMSPEQARSKPVDRRADIWAFGCVLYEMLTGQPAFGAEDVPMTLARVLSQATDMRSLPTDTAPALRHTIELCLEKDPKKRIADISDVRLALKGSIGRGIPAGATPTVAQPFWRRVLTHTGALVAGGVAVGVVLWLALQPQPQPVNRFGYVIPDAQVLRNTGRNVLAFSPDGRHFVYNTAQGLFLREMRMLEARLIPGTEESLTNPFFSPDGQIIAYWGGNNSRQLKRIALSGGAAVIVADVPENPIGASWARDNTIFYGQTTGIFRVAANGGTPVLVIEPEAGEQLASPELLPDDDTVLFSVSKGNSNAALKDSQIVAQTLSTGVRTTLVQGGSDAHYLPTGHLVYALDDSLFAVAFDAATLTVTGAAVPLVQGVSRARITASANYGVSANGTLVYLTGTGSNQLRNLVWVDRDGGETAIAIEPGIYVAPNISPTGDRVVVEERSSINDLWVWDFAGETRTRLTLEGLGGQTPVWTNDALRIAYSVPGASSIDWKAANNTGLTANLAAKSRLAGQDGRTVIPYPDFFSPSGEELVFSTRNAGADEDIGMITVEGDEEPVWLVRTPYAERNAELSPNGRWMAYESNESGSYQIYVRPFPNVNDDLVQVSNAGGWEPLWSRDGSELFYIEQDLRMMSVAVETDATDFVFGTRTAVIDWPYFIPDVERPYDVSPDGQRFLALKNVVNPDQQDATNHIVIIENWLEELERLVPTE